jgi:pimeloyl-ACP methyl ester carboxylesterase
MFGPIERTLIYHPVQSANLSPAAAGLQNGRARSITVHVDNRRLKLNGWHVVRRESSTPTNGSAGIPRLLTLFFPGNGGNRAYRIPEIEVLLGAGSDVLIVDYRGYGDNPGAPSEKAIAADAREFWKFATDELRLSPSQIILYGESLGGAVATRLASELCEEGSPPAGVILRSTFSRLTDVASEHYPWLPVRLVMGERYPSIERIARVTAPILIVHGERDMVVQYEHGVRLFEAAPATSADGTPKQFVTLPKSDHNDVLETEPEKFQSAIESFVQNLKSRDSNNSGQPTGAP